LERLLLFATNVLLFWQLFKYERHRNLLVLPTPYIMLTYLLRSKAGLCFCFTLYL